MPKKIKHTIAHSVMNTLAKDIIQGVYDDVGMLPSENELSNIFSTSRTSVRDALQALSAKGMITIQPKKRCLLKDKAQWNYLDSDLLHWIAEIGINAELFEQLIVLRLMLEPNACALAAINASGKDLACLEIALEMMCEAQNSSNSELYEEGDINFHQALLSASNNLFVLSLMEPLKQAMLLSFKQTQEPIASETYATIELHRHLLESIRMRDSKGASQAMTAIILSAAQKYECAFDVAKYQYFLAPIKV